MFAPGGLMDDFFQKNLQSIVDTTSHPWRFANRNADADPSAAAMLASFEKAAVIRDVYFGGARTAQLKVQIQPLEMDPSITEMVLDVDGQIVRYAHGPLVQSAVNWPRAAATRCGCRCPGRPARPTASRPTGRGRCTGCSTARECPPGAVPTR